MLVDSKHDANTSAEMTSGSSLRKRTMASRRPLACLLGQWYGQSRSRRSAKSCDRQLVFSIGNCGGQFKQDGQEGRTRKHQNFVAYVLGGS